MDKSKFFYGKKYLLKFYNEKLKTLNEYSTSKILNIKDFCKKNYKKRNCFFLL